MKTLTILLIFCFTSGVSLLDEEVKAKEYWKDLRNLESWSVFPSTNELMPGNAPHGAYITIHVNNIAHEATRDNNTGQMPVGAIIAKENFDYGRTLQAITMMRKTTEGWFWAQYSPDGQVLEAGLLQECISCHKGANKDMVFSWE